ncbi:ComF family protein [Clostridium botulinum]|uniref:ComF family protein n=1 Tax=Clostridium TaxID=1485 RepID=UPI00050663F1|nr:phosphoribosyltransferase family protein [Clostridium sp. M14]AIY81024.1 phosphoribosyl transferase domain protein [Clostridium botulinum 202F]KAI3344304.1 ComF family protein [Clostridium botulinum]KFX58521.1 competence protein ComF [Clostridium botulinum]KON13214.1 competence protein ComF [Clostridium botulinum]MBY6804117.1 ComF family protein [Clostridium botulinum]
MGKNIKKIIKIIYESLVSIIYPIENYCILCKRNDYVGICDICKSKITCIKNNDNEIISYGYYGGVIKELILKFKYKNNFTAGDILAEFLEKYIIDNMNYKEYIITYIPMTIKSQKKRGFNQCEYIAKKIANSLNIECKKILIKVKDTKEQKMLNKNERKENISGSFDVIKKIDLTDKKIILIDDVTTTGFTIREGYKILKKYGAKEIKLLTLAKSHI